MPKAGMMGDVETMTEEQWMNQEKMEDSKTHNQKYTSRDEVHTHLNWILLMQPTKFTANAEKFVIKE